MRRCTELRTVDGRVAPRLVRAAPAWTPPNFRSCAPSRPRSGLRRTAPMRALYEHPRSIYPGPRWYGQQMYQRMREILVIFSQFVSTEHACCLRYLCRMPASRRVARTPRNAADKPCRCRTHRVRDVRLRVPPIVYGSIYNSYSQPHPLDAWETQFANGMRTSRRGTFRTTALHAVHAQERSLILKLRGEYRRFGTRCVRPNLVGCERTSRPAPIPDWL
ncbi:hypothetical protein DFH07DRAFT_855845 [Mycena maculata]|uniref:Uncharacterized protein n=1 Tax=Mycena maculata TaxID=230809 RepID=A0AAD7HLF8_9AGAR|nr:hypothetical protein DFH07DRAFT_855845 [Mycena maculata]